MEAKDVANIVLAIVVPLVSAFVAHNLIVQKDRKERIMDAFVKIMSDVQEYRHAFMDHLWNKVRGFNEPPNEVSNRIRQIDTPASFCRVRDSVTTFNNDCLVLGLLFGKKADELGTKLRALAASTQIVIDGPPMELFNRHGEYEAHLASDIKAVSTEIKKLWKEVDSPFAAAMDEHV